jgi:endoglycosylceramidase
MCKKLISTQGTKFIDIQGRQTILHGINMVCKDKERNYIGDYKEEDFVTLKQWGFNVIRLGIFWDGVEPTPGEYNDKYLSEIERLIELAKKNNLYVFLDMHQDLYSCKYSDGAPEWATITHGQEHTKTDLWSESYLLSRAVQVAFDNFWNNREAADGVGIQDHFINMWRHIATRYKDNTNVIGYDILNEPFMGSEVNHLVPALLSMIGDMLAESEPVAMEELMERWLDPVKKLDLLSLLSDKDLYLKLVRETEGISQHFEKTFLNDLYTKTGRAIREVDEETILLLEANYFSNTGMRSSISPIVELDGTQVKYQAFSPHGYDLLVDTEMYNLSSNKRIDVIFETHKSVQEDLQLPMLVGEWGCFPNASEEQLGQAYYLTGLFEKYLSGDTYYDFSHIYHNRIIKAISKSYPMKVAGDIISYSNNYSERNFACTIRENKTTGSSVIYVPDLLSIGEISVEPYEKGYTLEKIEGCNSGYINIPASELPLTRTIYFKNAL